MNPSPAPQKGPSVTPKELFSVRANKATQEPKSKQGVFFVVSKKVAKNATERNFLKRKYRHALRKTGIVPPKNKHIVVYIKEGSKKAKFSDLERALKKELS